LMIERSKKRGAFRGAVVFPGGVVDAADQDATWEEYLGTPLTSIQRLKLGAIRELFEETGILLATPPLHISREDNQRYRERVHAQGHEFVKLCRELQVKPDLDSLKLVQRWVTPLHVPKRFDTFFFVAAVEGAKGAAADGNETTRLAWLPPSQVLAFHDTQDVSLLPPQYYQLATLAAFPQLQAVRQHLATLDEVTVEPWQPHPLSAEEGGPGMCYPGDCAFPSAVPGGAAPMSRHRLLFRKVAKKDGGAGGKGMPENSVLSGVNSYVLERNVHVPFGAGAWAGKIVEVPLSKL